MRMFKCFITHTALFFGLVSSCTKYSLNVVQTALNLSAFKITIVALHF